MGTTVIEYAQAGRFKDGFIDNVQSAAAGSTLAAALHPYTTAGIERVFYTIVDFVDLPADNTEEFQGLDTYCLMTFRDTAGDIVKLAIPAPRISLFDLDAKGYHLQQEHGQAIASLLSTAIGGILVFEKSCIHTI